MMDLFYGDSTPRLVQSYVSTPALELGDLAFTYDNALVILALLARGTADDVTRARVLGDALVFAQKNDPVPDGRIRSAYYVHPFVKPDGLPNLQEGPTLDVGNTAWTGLALMKLYFKTGEASYLECSKALGKWIFTNAWDTRGAGGYTGGLTPGGDRLRWKSSEHNIDTYAFFTMLAKATSDSKWTTRAQPALTLLDSMWVKEKGFFWAGTLEDGITRNELIPADVQSWSYLATSRKAYEGALDWAHNDLSATDAGFSGVSFSNVDRSGVWFEGTAQLAAALNLRNNEGDKVEAAKYLESIARAEESAPHADGYGIVAASKDGLNTGVGFQYFAALHIGATAWYAMAEYDENPFVSST
jgi:hypothetical protein